MGEATIILAGVKVHPSSTESAFCCVGEAFGWLAHSAKWFPPGAGAPSASDQCGGV